MKINHVHGNIKINIIKFFSNLFSHILFYFFKIFCPGVKRKSNDILISRATYAPWKIDKKYLKVSKISKDLTLLDDPRLFTFYYLSKQISHIDADILDIGCMRGGVGIFVSKMNSKGRTFLFDTFDGFLDKEKLHRGQVFKYDGLHEVEQLIGNFNLKDTFVYKKFFPRDIDFLKIKKIKLCHIDVNTYQSTKKSYNFVKNKIIKNGFIIFDDYGIYGVERVTRLIEKIIKNDSKKFNFFFNYFGQCILIKK